MPKLNSTDTSGQSAEEILAATAAASGNEEIESQVDDGPTEEEVEVTKAEKQGWRPLEEWDGDPDDWVDAKTFNQRGDKIASIATSRAKRQQSRIDMLEAQLVSVSDKYAQINARERAQAKATSDVLEQRIQQLEAQKESALNASDAVAAMRIDKQIVEVQGRKDAADEVVEATAPVKTNNAGGGALPPEAAAWQKNNPWFGPDIEATVYADGMGNFYKKNINPNATVTEMLDYVDKKVAQRFPEYGDKKTMRKPASAEGGNSGMRTGNSRTNVNTGGITYSDLPAEAKQICDSLVKTIKGYTREKYLAKYNAAK